MKSFIANGFRVAFGWIVAFGLLLWCDFDQVVVAPTKSEFGSGNHCDAFQSTAVGRDGRAARRSSFSQPRYDRQNQAVLSVLRSCVEFCGYCPRSLSNTDPLSPLAGGNSEVDIGQRANRGDWWWRAKTFDSYGDDSGGIHVESGTSNCRDGRHGSSVRSTYYSECCPSCNNQPYKEDQDFKRAGPDGRVGSAEHVKGRTEPGIFEPYRNHWCGASSRLRSNGGTDSCYEGSCHSEGRSPLCRFQHTDPIWENYAKATQDEVMDTSARWYISCLGHTRSTQFRSLEKLLACLQEHIVHVEISICRRGHRRKEWLLQHASRSTTRR